MVIGSIIRYDRDPFTWKSKSSQLLRKRQFIAGSVLFHVGVLMIFAGHLVGLLTPIQIFDVMGVSHGAKQILAVVAGGIAGIMALVGGVDAAAPAAVRSAHPRQLHFGRHRHHGAADGATGAGARNHRRLARPSRRPRKW